LTDKVQLATAIGSEGASPIIRVPWPEEWMIKRALDSGAHGILTPMCHSAVGFHRGTTLNTHRRLDLMLTLSQEDARKIVRFCKYPPLGSRGYGPMYAAHALPKVTPGAQYDNNADKELLVMVQIESRSGVDNVEEIAKVEGLDVLLIGEFVPKGRYARGASRAQSDTLYIYGGLTLCRPVRSGQADGRRPRWRRARGGYSADSEGYQGGWQDRRYLLYVPLV
jgi:hypothetical protein